MCKINEKQESDLMDLVYDRLYVGRMEAVNYKTCHDNSIYGILNVAIDLDDQKFQYINGGPDFKKVGLYDTGPEGAVIINDPNALMKAVVTLDRIYNAYSDKNILVHCHSGGSRSVIVAALWLAQKVGGGLDPGQSRVLYALNIVRNARGLGMGDQDVPYNPFNPNYGNPEASDFMWPDGKPMAALFYLAAAIDALYPDLFQGAR